MEIYLVRHTETLFGKGICYGQSDIGLLEPYEEQFELIKNQLPQKAFFFSSPLQRCAILANRLSQGNFISDNRLMEMNFGDWEGKPWDDIPQEQLSPWMSDFVNISVPNGESFVTLHQRVGSFVAEKLHSLNAPVVIVSHAGVIRSLLCYQAHLPLDKAFSNTVEFGQVIKTIF